MVIWFAGLSGAGKTTLANALQLILKERLYPVVKLDGDEIRKSISFDLGYQESDRVIQIRRMQGLAKLLSEQGLIVLVSALYARDDLLEWNRNHINNYFEVYVRASLDLLKKRDSKGLYSQSPTSQINSVVGLDIQWHEPQKPDLIIDSNDTVSPKEQALQVLQKIKILEKPVVS